MERFKNGLPHQQLKTLCGVEARATCLGRALKAACQTEPRAPATPLTAVFRRHGKAARGSRRVLRALRVPRVRLTTRSPWPAVAR